MVLHSEFMHIFLSFSLFLHKTEQNTKNRSYHYYENTFFLYTASLNPGYSPVALISIVIYWHRTRWMVNWVVCIIWFQKCQTESVIIDIIKKSSVVDHETHITSKEFVYFSQWIYQVSTEWYRYSMCRCIDNIINVFGVQHRNSN